MKFQITRTRFHYDKSIPPCPEATYEPGHGIWWVELPTLIDFCRFVQFHEGRVVVELDEESGAFVIEIYDDYRE